jgi:ferrous iron transport protein B
MTESCHGDAGVSVKEGTPRIAVVGPPNAGKSTIFNALTGLRVKTGNYAGVTVGRTEGEFNYEGVTLALEDLPGTYSLEPVSLDEAVAVDMLHGRLQDVDPPDAVVVVADSTTLRRGMVLVADMLALNMPTLLCLSMSDELAARGGRLNPEALSQELGVPVVVVDGRRRSGIQQLAEELPKWREWSRPVVAPPTDMRERAGWLKSVLQGADYVPPKPDGLSAKVDRVVLNPIAGPIIFFGVMFAFFQVIFSLAAPLQDGIEAGLGWLGDQSQVYLGDGLVGSFVNDALIGGVGAVLVFVPQIALLFIMIAVLEQTGYLSRAAFLMDRVMASAGLEGRAFVALLSSYACAVPGIMATRTMPSAKERFATMMTLPMVTCSARLPVYTLLIGMLIPSTSKVWMFGAQGVFMFALYVLGAVAMMVSARIVSAVSSKKARKTPFSLELPPYRMPVLRSLVAQVWQPVKGFLRKTGTVIAGATIVVWALLNLPMQSDAALTAAGVDTGDAAAVSTYTMNNSIAAKVGHAVEPVFDPLGFDWRTNVAVISSLAARETFVATLGQMTAAEDPEDPGTALESATFDDGPKAGQPVYTIPTVIALLAFFAFALQCISTLATLKRETGGWKWPMAALGGYFVLAWVVAFAAREIALLFV